MNQMNAIERAIENTIFASRWLLIIFLGGLALALAAYSVYFVKELIIVFYKIFTTSYQSNEILLKMLVLIDKTLVASLIVMVILSGYENFISRFNTSEGREHLAWLGKLDPGSVKIKLASSIVAISSIHLLKVYLDIEQVKEQWHVLWLTIIHVVFLSGAMMLGYLGRLSNHE